MTRGFASCTLALAFLAGTALTLRAATPTFWHVASLPDFVQGELANLSIDSDGRLTLGPSNRAVADTDAPIIWRLVSADDGSLLAGTGNDGKVFRVARDGTLSTAFDARELQVHALALARDGAFYAGTSPEGRVYKVARDGTVIELFDPEDTYIWAIAVAPDGALFVGTGEKGLIYKVAPDGTSRVFYQTRATNVTALTFDPQGNLLAGTSSPGQVHRIDAQGRGFVLLESPYSEIRALHLDPRGNLYAVAVSGRAAEAQPAETPSPPERTSAPIPSVSTEITITAIGDVATSAGSASPTIVRNEARRDAPRGAIYRISPDNLWEPIWEATDDQPFDVMVQPDDSLLVATGGKGRLLRLEGDPVKVTVVARAEAQQVTSLARAGQGRLFYATANPGKIFELGRAPVPEGTYESDVRDATNVASWGLIRWRATTPPGSAIQLFTRSGNTRMPDETWSPWSTPYTRSAGELIVSPKARYLQWKASLTGKGASPVLTSVTVAYLPRNTRPTISSVTVQPPGLVFARPFPTGEPEIAGYDNGTAEARPQPPAAVAAATSGGSPALGRRLYQKGLQTFIWGADDEPGDTLQFDVYYRRQGDTEWLPMHRGLWDSILTWDTTSVPDGTYTVKIVASDAPSNAPRLALATERESELFEVDNTAPDITVTDVGASGGRPVVRFTVKDGHSPLSRVEYSLDAVRWRVVYPSDGIADSAEEQFEVTLESGVGLPVTIRAVDDLNNVASAVVSAPPPRP